MTEDDEPCPCVSTRSGELNLVLEGQVTLEIGPAKQQVTMRAGDACLVPRGLPHAVRVPESGRVLMIDVRGQVADQGLRLVPAKLLPARVLKTIDRVWTRRIPDALRSTAAVAEEVLRRLESREPLVIEATPATRLVTRAKEILEAEFANPPSLAVLARRLRTNEFYLLRAFKKHFSFSPLAYAQFLRTEHFVWELLGAPSEQTLLRLSSDAGFGDYSTFQRRIRGMFGKRPSELVEEPEQGKLGP